MPIYQPRHSKNFIHKIYTPVEKGDFSSNHNVKRVYEIGIDGEGKLRPILVFSNYNISYGYGPELNGKWTDTEGNTGASIYTTVLADNAFYSDTWCNATKLPLSSFTDELRPVGPEGTEADKTTVFDEWSTYVTEDSDAYDEGFVEPSNNYIKYTQLDNFKEYDLYTNLQRVCVGDLTNNQETVYATDPETEGGAQGEGYSTSEGAENASKEKAAAGIETNYESFINDEYKYIRGGVILSTKATRM